jgi:hypothetical protein
MSSIFRLLYPSQISTLLMYFLWLVVTNVVASMSNWGRPLEPTNKLGQVESSKCCIFVVQEQQGRIKVSCCISLYIFFC